MSNHNANGDTTRETVGLWLRFYESMKMMSSDPIKTNLFRVIIAKLEAIWKEHPWLHKTGAGCCFIKIVSREQIYTTRIRDWKWHKNKSSTWRIINARKTLQVPLAFVERQQQQQQASMGTRWRWGSCFNYTITINLNFPNKHQVRYQRYNARGHGGVG